MLCDNVQCFFAYMSVIVLVVFLLKCPDLIQALGTLTREIILYIPYKLIFIERYGTGSQLLKIRVKAS